MFNLYKEIVVLNDSIPKQITVECNNGKKTFDLTTQKASRAFLEVFIFTDRLSSFGDDRIIRAGRRAFWVCEQNAKLRRDCLAGFRQLPQRIIVSLRLLDPKTSYSFGALFLDLVQITLRDHARLLAWKMNTPAIFDKQELGNLMIQLAKLCYELNADNDLEIVAGGVRISEALHLMDSPYFLQILNELSP